MTDDMSTSLRNALISAKADLYKAYDEYSRVAFEELPNYLDLFENEIVPLQNRVAENEIALMVLKKKKTLIQASLNRRETINEDENQKLLAEYRNELLLSATEDIENALSISDCNKAESNKIYERIVEKFHPEKNNITSILHRFLYNKALEVYKRNDTLFLKYIYELMNFAPLAGETGEILYEAIINDENSVCESADYSLVYLLSDYFENLKPAKEESESIIKTRQRMQEIKKKTDIIKSSELFLLSDILQDSEKLRRYKAELEFKCDMTKKMCDDYEEEIKLMTQEAMYEGRDA